MDGLFILKSKYENTPAIKTGKNSYQLINGEFEVYDIINKKKQVLSAFDYLVYQLNQRRPLLHPQLKSIEDLNVPVIDFDVFRNYDERQAEIDTNTKLQKDFDKANFKILNNTKLIVVKSNTFNCPNEIYIAKNGKFSRAEDILEPKELKKAKDFSKYTLTQLQKRLEDNLVNQFSDEYEKAVELWESL